MVVYRIRDRATTRRGSVESASRWSPANAIIAALSVQ